MNKLCWLIGLLVTSILAGCGSEDIVTTNSLKMLEHKCVYIAPLESDDPHVGKVIKDVLEKELMREKIELCDPNTATVLFTGSTFMTVRGGGAASNQAIESVSLVGKDINGEMLLSASYDNKERYSASQLAKQFGSTLAKKLK
ncbi:MAG: hypothetical protein A2168_02770 [Planctomycetes bacterium RBG_13_50_24]|nr:MAG: hypothetical protein A2168_02770 [Planctomycetes bacterium RBG_13_50_24]